MDRSGTGPGEVVRGRQGFSFVCFVVLGIVELSFQRYFFRTRIGTRVGGTKGQQMYLWSDPFEDRKEYVSIVRQT